MIVPRGHPLAKEAPLTLAALARHPIVTYDATFTGRSQINAAFDAEGIVPNVGTYGPYFHLFPPYSAPRDEGWVAGVSIEKTSSTLERAQSAGQYPLQHPLHLERSR